MSVSARWEKIPFGDRQKTGLHSFYMYVHALWKQNVSWDFAYHFNINMEIFFVNFVN